MAPNSIGPLGVTTATQAELLANSTTNYETIYGADIDLDSDTPDGQTINNQIQAVLDVSDLITQVNAMFDPDQAIGVILDQRCAINGVVRQGGTFTVTNVTVITALSVNLYGIDQTEENVYTVSDNAGNLWELQNTVLGLSIGTNVLSVQAAEAGAIISIPNTITVPVTIVLGVTSVNNPTTYTTLGINEESDVNLKLRRQQSVSLASQGYYAGLKAALLNINGVSSAFIYENDTNATDADGVPSHSIWVIVAGSATDSAIANAIYQKRNAGCGMFGMTSYNITQVDGTLFTVYWDVVMPQDLFITLNAISVNGTTQPNIAAILSGLPTSFVPGVYSEVNITALGTAVQAIDPNTFVTSAGFTTGQTQILVLSGVPSGGTFEINYDGNASAAINWNDSLITINSKVQAVIGLADAVVTGTIAGQMLTFNLTLIQNVQGLIYVSNNSLHTSVPVAITFSYVEGYSNTLLPAKKDYQFAVASANIIILPMILSPTISTNINALATVQFTGLGGYGVYVYSLSINNSGASINSSTGVYTAGSTINVTDTILVVDVFGNAASATVGVV